MIKIGDKVLCRFYNTPDEHFYGECWTGIVEDIREHKIYFKYWGNSFWVEGEEYYVIPNHMPVAALWIQRKEIKRIIK